MEVVDIENLARLKRDYPLDSYSLDQLEVEFLALAVLILVFNLEVGFMCSLLYLLGLKLMRTCIFISPWAW